MKKYFIPVSLTLFLPLSLNALMYGIILVLVNFVMWGEAPDKNLMMVMRLMIAVFYFMTQFIAFQAFYEWLKENENG